MNRSTPEVKPTIAHILPWGSIGGVEIATTRIIAATKHRFRHIAFCLEEASELQDICRDAGAEIVTYLPPTSSIRHGARFLQESNLVADQIRREKVDLIHLSDLKAAFHVSLAGLLARRPSLCHVRSRFPKLSLRERLCLLPVTRYLFVSKASRLQFGLHVPDSRARVVYDGMDLLEPRSAEDEARVRAEIDVAPDAPLVGMIARVNPQKDYDTLAAAAALVLERRPDTRFVVVGDNSIVELNRKHYAHVREVLTDLGIADKFRFTGIRSDVPRFVSALDIFVLSTHREGVPLSILEAMSMGKPVVATRVDGIPEVLTEGVTGLMHEHGDSRGLADAILSCIENPEKARAMGAAARELCRHSYTNDRFASDMERVYLELIQGR